MTPAEELSRSKLRKRAPHGQGVRRVVWDCRIRQAREALNLSLKDVSKATGVSVAVICSVEHGTEPMLSTAAKLAAFFGKGVGELWLPLAKEGSA